MWWISRLLNLIIFISFYCPVILNAQTGLSDSLQTLTGLDPVFKVSPSLLSFMKLIPGDQLITTQVLSTDKVSLPALLDHIQEKPGTVRINGETQFLWTLTLTENQIMDLVKYPFVSAIEHSRTPSTEARQEGLDLSLNQITFLHHQYPGLSGTGMHICIKENLFDTTDIDFKGRINSLELASDLTDVHATNMASISAGGGNSGPSSKGVAWDASISSSDFSNLLPDPDPHFIAHDISVQNHAYGTGIENYYGIESAAYDAMTLRLPSVLHVFSSGNRGDQAPAEGTYMGLSGWANLTGQFKQSKNTITVGATDSLDHVVTQSSRGPAYDGRIKPELVAYGHGGSSGAAALVSGASLLIQQAFKEIYGVLPPSSLVKAALINSARDIETKGPDYKSGYGSLRAFLALQLIEEGRFINDEIKKDETTILMVGLTAGMDHLKFTLAWLDAPASPLSKKSLVNDLDLFIEHTASGKTWQPWILNHDAHADSLNLPAKTGVDTLNNVEQILIEDPAPGEYHIIIKGADIHDISSSYSLVWEFTQKNKFEWVFPTGTDHLKPGIKNILRWQSSVDENGIIEFRMIGEDWQLINTDVNPDSGYIYWQPPAVDGLAQLRWVSGNAEVVSDTFVISNPLLPEVLFVCGDSLLLSWQADRADSFEIYILGPKHLQLLGIAIDSFYTSDHPDVTNPYYAVAPLYGKTRGPLSYTIDYTKQGAGCYLNIFYLRHVLNRQAFFSAELGTLQGIDFIILEKKIDDQFVEVLQLVQLDSTILFFESDQLSQGINDFRLTIVLSNGERIYSDIVRVYYAGEHDVLIFPNPASSDQEITLVTTLTDDFELRIFDIQGREIFKAAQFEYPVVIPAFNLVSGIYIVQIISAGGIHVSEKLLIYR